MLLHAFIRGLACTSIRTNKQVLLIFSWHRLPWI